MQTYHPTANQNDILLRAKRASIRYGGMLWGTVSPVKGYTDCGKTTNENGIIIFDKIELLCGEIYIGLIVIRGTYDNCRQYNDSWITYGINERGQLICWAS